MSSTTQSNGRLLLSLALVTGLACGCAGSAGPKSHIPPSDGPLSGPPRALLRVPPVMQRGQPYKIELAITGACFREALNRPIAVRLTIVDSVSSTSVTSWGDPRVSRYFQWVVPAEVTRDIHVPLASIHIAVHHLAGYTVMGKPILSEPFLWTSTFVKVQHPVANSGAALGIHQTEVLN